MAIKLTYRDLDDTAFASAIRKISNYTKFTPLMLRWAGKVADKYLKEMMKANEVGQKTAKNFGKLDEKGDVIVSTKSPGFELLEGKEEEWKVAKDEFEAIEFQMHVEPISLNVLENVGLSPIEVLAIEKLLLPEEVEVKSTEEKK